MDAIGVWLISCICMIVIAAKTKNQDCQKQHWDFLEETCRSFGASLHDIDQPFQPFPAGTPVSLCHDRGQSLSGFEWPENPVILIGCDDSHEHDEWLNAGIQVRIETPVDYFLWSPVAAGIALYHYHQSLTRDNRSACKHPHEVVAPDLMQNEAVL